MQSKYFPFEIILHTRLSFPSEMVGGKLEVFVEFNIFSRHSFKNDVVFDEIVFRKNGSDVSIFLESIAITNKFLRRCWSCIFEESWSIWHCNRNNGRNTTSRVPRRKHPFCHFSFSHVPQLTFRWVGFWLGWESDSRPPRSSSLLHVETNRWFETWLDSWPAIYQIYIFNMVQRC